MKHYIYVLALCLLLAAATSSPAHAASSSLDMPIASSFQVSGVAKAMDDTSAEISPGPGKIEITRGDHALYIRVSAPALSGTRLVLLDDYESSIVFRNNTMLLPLYATGAKTGDLVVATDNLMADSGGYAGMITGLELDSGKITAARDGRNFTVGAILSLTDLPAAGKYRLAFVDNASLQETISADLEVNGQRTASASPVIEVSASTPTAGNAVSFVIVTLETDQDWPGLAGEKNFTFYRYAGGQLSHLPFTMVRSGDGGLAYQAISPGPGQFAVVAGAPRDTVTETVTAGNYDAIVLGGLLAALVIALAIMVRRVAKR